MRCVWQGLGLAAGLLAVAGAQAVVLGARDRGQVLIFPYYTTNAGNTTLVSLSNDSDRGKVVQLRVAEGDIGETALVFNLYLGPRDSWSAALALDEGGQAFLQTEDNSCHQPLLPAFPPGHAQRRRQTLSVPDSTPGSADGILRSREGWLEAIEVATILRDNPTSLAVGNARGGTAPDCAAINAAWNGGNAYWRASPTRDLANPSGGLSGYSAVINVAQGTYFGVTAVALDEFRVDPQDGGGNSSSVVSHFLPDARRQLGLDDAITDPRSRDVEASIVVDSRSVRLAYPLERGIDAVSAVLAASELSADFDTTQSLGATTSFVQLFPTRRYYTNPDLLPPGTSAPLPPFRVMYNAQQPLALNEAGWLLLLGRDGSVLADSGREHFKDCATDSRHPATALAVTAPGGGGADPLLGTRYAGPMGLHCADGVVDPLSASGIATLRLDTPLFGSEPIQLRPSRQGQRVRGVPVIALRLLNYVNTGARPGVLANYSAAVPMAAAMACVSGTGMSCSP
jgi:hypothetical protein